MASLNKKVKRSKRSQKNKNMNGSEYRPTNPNSALMVPNRVGLILPDRYRTKLRFWKSVQTSLAASVTSAVRFQPSAAYDIDPVLASTTMAGFNELAGLYARYRVLASTIKVECANVSNLNPLMLVVAPTNLDPGATPSSAYILALKEQPYAKAISVPLVGGPLGVIESRMTTEKIFGSKMVLFDDAFQAGIATVPTNNWFWVISWYSFQLIATSFVTNVTIEVDVEFFDRTFLQI